MGLLDQLSAQVLGTQGAMDGSEGGIARVALDLLQQHEGGLGGFLSKLEGAGLGQEVSSWIGTGSNLPVGASQLAAALGPDVIRRISGELGQDSSHVASTLAGLLPQLIDRLTPSGSVDDAAPLLSQGQSFLATLLR
ncbi:YidB family protein [Niveibacterium sp. SC-1]|uniref:YidB family protein n=1 Tax=Niveibacterium sp. SC-1 TaxID=3135646 RepID=UPI00311EBFDA